MEAPSAVSHPTSHNAIQTDHHENILDNVAEADDAAPIELIYPGFGAFLDAVAGRGPPMPFNKCKALVDDLVSDMSKSHGDELARQNVAIEHVKGIFGLDKCPRIQAD